MPIQSDMIWVYFDICNATVTLTFFFCFISQYHMLKMARIDDLFALREFIKAMLLLLLYALFDIYLLYELV